jgi:hypothetical protein
MTTTTKDKTRSTMLAIVAIIAGLVITPVVIAPLMPTQHNPVPAIDHKLAVVLDDQRAIIARQEAGTHRDAAVQECISNKGRLANGAVGWRGSSGVTLEKFCEGAAAYDTIVRDMREHPERY